jgi:hypothetical protein
LIDQKPRIDLDALTALMLVIRRVIDGFRWPGVQSPWSASQNVIGAVLKN